MERILYLIRHATAEESPLSGIRDFDRALTPEGRNLARQQAGKMLEKNIRLDGLVGSSAMRAWQTAEIIAQTMQIAENRCVKWPLLYSAGIRDLNAMRISKSWATVGVVGHNPALSDWAAFLTKNYSTDIPPGGIVGISFPISQWMWPKAGSLVVEIFP